MCKGRPLKSLHGLEVNGIVVGARIAGSFPKRKAGLSKEKFNRSRLKEPRLPETQFGLTRSAEL